MARCRSHLVVGATLGSASCSRSALGLGRAGQRKGHELALLLAPGFVAGARCRQGPTKAPMLAPKPMPQRPARLGRQAARAKRRPRTDCCARTPAGVGTPTARWSRPAAGTRALPPAAPANAISVRGRRRHTGRVRRDRHAAEGRRHRPKSRIRVARNTGWRAATAPPGGAQLRASHQPTVRAICAAMSQAKEPPHVLLHSPP
jgi:hypothetical protein